MATVAASPKIVPHLWFPEKAEERYGLSWQIVPTVLGELLRDPDRARAGRVMTATLGMRKLDVAGLRRAAEGR